jgi:isopenicillin-N N-acyltransferase-like protein
VEAIMNAVDLIEIHGPPFERGQQYGSQAARAIEQSVAAYLDLIEFQAAVPGDRAMEAARSFQPVLQEHAPALLREMEGIASGAGCDLADILLLNSRSELMGQVDECTALAATAGVTQAGGVLLAQNWDWYTAVKQKPVLLRVRQPDKPELLTLAEPGQLAKFGMNSAGLGVCLNFMSHVDRGHGLPVHILLRQMLECEALGDAVRLAIGQPRGGAANIMVAHGQGEIIDLELTATRADFIYGDSGWLAHANHFESQRLREGDTGITRSASSVARAARARRLMAGAAAGRGAGLETFQAILSDHAYGPYAICRHPVREEPPLQQSATRASAIMELATGRFHLAAGQPCKVPYQEFRIASLDAGVA